MKHFLLTLLLALVSATSFAAETDSISISGNVLDAFTREYLDSVSVKMYELPSMRLVTKTMINDWINRYDDPERRKEIERWDPRVRRRIYRMKGVPGTYLLCFSCKGYQDKEEQITIPPKRYGRRTETWEVKDVLLDKDRTHHLGEAVVNATKIKMMTKGDTLIYNADAFQLADGSMLDGLIAMMPGLEIRNGSQIYQNGEYIPELLLNGKDFFNGDPAVALKNLPAYTVKDLRIYHKAPDGAYLRKDLTKTDTLSWNKVLDVRLKKQYSHGWITNAEVAGGTPLTPRTGGTVTSSFESATTTGVPSSPRSGGTRGVGLARLFGLHFSDHTRLGVFANINNINDTGLANNQGDWDSSWTPEPGVTTMQLGALDFTVDGKKTKINYNTNVQAVREVSDTQAETSATTFLPTGDVFNRSRYSTNYDRFHFVWANNLKWDGKKASFTFRPGLDFFRKTYDTESLSAQFSGDPQDSYRGAALDSLYLSPTSQRLQQLLVNSVNSTLHRTTDTWTQSANLFTYFTDPKFGRPVSIVLSQSYTHEAPHETQRYALTQFSSSHIGGGGGGGLLENRSTLTPTDRFNLWGSFEYTFHKWGILTSDLRYSYSKNYSKNSRERYVQDLSDPSTGSGQALPSNLQTFDLDLENSFHATRNRDAHSLSLPFELHFTEDLSLEINPSLQHTRDYYADTRGQISEATRHSTFFRPSASLFYHYRPLGADSLARKSGYIRLNYNFSQDAPDAIFSLAIRDSSDPLRITLGNPNLNNSYTHSLSFQHHVNRKSSNMSSALSYSRRQQQIAQAMSYNAETGVYTYRPENVDGNWNVNGNFSYNTTLNNSPFHIGTYTYLGYNNSVDLISPDGLSDAVRSEVHNTLATERLGIDYNHKNISARIYGTVNWYYATSERQNFTTRSTFDYTYGATFNANNFLWGFSFSTDLALRQRRGYDDASMNDNNLIWDAQLSRSFGKTKAWNVRLKGHDLLRQLSNVTRTLNAQGLTETWTNSLPSFLMLHVSYKWNKQPKKK